MLQQGTKFDNGKIPTHLLAPDALLAALHAPEPDLDTIDGSDPYDSVYLEEALFEFWNGKVDSGALMLTSIRVLQTELGGDRGVAELEISKVLDFGQKKYAPRNWEKGILYSRVYGAALRHVYLHQSGQILDEETGLNHLAHAACCVMFLVAYELRGMKDFDDRPIRKDRITVLPPPAAEPVDVNIPKQKEPPAFDNPEDLKSGDLVEIVDIHPKSFIESETRLFLGSRVQFSHAENFNFKLYDNWPLIHLKGYGAWAVRVRKVSGTTLAQ